MLKLNKTVIGLGATAFILLSGGLAIALDTQERASSRDNQWKRSCERQILVKTPNGRKDLTFASFEQQSGPFGIVEGSLKTKLLGKRWSKIRWNCRVDAKSGKVIRVEFYLPTSSSRLMAAASYLR